MSKYADKRFWVDAFDRAVASFAQALVATNAFETTGVVDLDWAQILSLSAGVALASLLTSVAFRGNGSDAVQIEILEPVVDDREFDNPDSPQFEKEER